MKLTESLDAHMLVTDQAVPAFAVADYRKIGYVTRMLCWADERATAGDDAAGIGDELEDLLLARRHIAQHFRRGRRRDQRVLDPRDNRAAV